MPYIDVGQHREHALRCRCNSFIVSERKAEKTTQSALRKRSERQRKKKRLQPPPGADSTLSFHFCGRVLMFDSSTSKYGVAPCRMSTRMVRSIVFSSWALIAARRASTCESCEPARNPR